MAVIKKQLTLVCSLDKSAYKPTSGITVWDKEGVNIHTFQWLCQEATHAGGRSGYSHIQATSGIAMWDRKGPYSVAATRILKAAI